MPVERHVMGKADGPWEANQRSPQHNSDFVIRFPDLKVDGPVVKALC